MPNGPQEANCSIHTQSYKSNKSNKGQNVNFYNGIKETSSPYQETLCHGPFWS